MKKKSIFDIIKTASEDFDNLKELANKLRENKPESTMYLDEASYHLQGVYVALHDYLNSL